MLCTKDLRAESAKWIIFAALIVWLGSQTAGASIVGAGDDLGNSLSAEPAVETVDESDIARVEPVHTTAAPIRIDPPGDYNGSGLVEQGDLDLVLSNWGTQVALLPTTWVNERPAALVDQSALDQVLLNWGKTATFTSPVAHMPEAGSMTVAVLLLASVLGARAAYRGIERMRSPVA
jgi:hypothetical protein